MSIPLHLIQTLAIADPLEGRPPFVSSGSGLELCGDWAYVAVDDEFHIGVFGRAPSAPGRLHRVLPGTLPAEPAERKASKPDLETVCAVATPSGQLLLGLPSGSTERRMTGFVHTLGPAGQLYGEPRPLDCRPLLDAIDGEFEPDVNVEGAVALADHFLLFLRCSTGANHVARLSIEAVLEDVALGTLSARALEQIEPCDLGELDGTPLGFSDAAVVGDRVLFTASAEATASAYDDGDVIGSVVGTLGPGCTAIDVHRFDAVEKVEGLAVADRIGSDLVLWLVTDDDDPDKPSRLLEARIPAR
ncbi:MAG: hypothetical protein JWM86_1732 [Thermoleophilia bacterium]|nr:hypothetical protein [Thermoleophilia bacterium]